MKKKALITGILGQDGIYLSKFLIKKNYKIIGIHNKKNKSQLTPYKKLLKDKITLIKCDIKNYHSLNRIINKINPDEIYNLAAVSSVAQSFQNPKEMIKINVIGLLNILEILRKKRKKISFYQASSSEMFGNNKNIFLSEKTVLNPVSPYGISKATSHYLVRFYRKAYNLECCSGILFNHESPLRNKNFVTKKIISNLCKIYNGENIIIKLGNIYSKRDWGYAPDYVEAMWKMLQLKKKRDFVIGTGKNYDVKTFINIACSYLNLKIKWNGESFNEKCINLNTNKKIIEIDKKLYRPLDISVQKCNPSNATKILKWSPKNNIYNLVTKLCDFELNKLPLKNKINSKFK